MTEPNAPPTDAGPTLRSRGIDALHSGAGPKRGRSVLQASVLPSLRGSPASWKVFAIVDGRQRVTHHVAVRTQWNRDLDRAVLGSRTAPPTIQRQTVLVPTPTVDALFADICAVRIALPPGKRPHGTDGTRYRLQLGDSFAHSTFEWWERGPDGWNDLVQSFRTLWSTLEELPPGDGAELQP